MSYKQIVAPNLDPVVYENGKPLLDWCGWCLATVECAFGTARTGRTAWDEWTNYVHKKHADRNWPRGVYFPIWFSGYGGEGHVAIAYVNSAGAMNIWTSPYEHIPYFNTQYHDVDTLARGYGVTYVGWSEDIGGSTLIEPIPSVPMITLAQLTQLYKDLLGRAPDAGGISHYVGHYTYAFVENDIKNSEEYKIVQARRAAAASASTPPKVIPAAPSASVPDAVPPTSTGPTELPSSGGPANPSPNTIQDVKPPVGVIVPPSSDLPQAGPPMPDPQPNAFVRFLKWFFSFKWLIR